MKKKLLKFIPILSVITFVPMVALAASTCTATGGLGLVLCKISELLSAILPVLVALGVIYFIWGVVQYFIADSEEAKKTGKDRIIYGIIGLAVIVSVWGLVFIVTDTLGLSTNGTILNNAPNVTGLVTTPTTSSACTPVAKPLFQDILNYFTCIIGQSVIPFIFALAVVMFIWGAVKFFIINADEEAKRAQGKQFMIWGIIALAVMISVWGLVGILGDTFNIGHGVLPTVKP